MTQVSFWLNFVLDVFKYGLNQTLIFYPLLVCLGLSVLATIAFVIKYVCKSSL